MLQSSSNASEKVHGFDGGAIARWANLSGDHNPIHFDAGRARAAGADGVIVHGMLALLSVEQRLDPRLRTLSDPRTGSLDAARWPTIKAFFRTPVVKDRDYRLNVTCRRGRVRFALCAAESDVDVITGQLTLSAPTFAPPPPSRGAAPPAFVVEGSELTNKLAEFVRSFPELERLWVAVDALAFGGFLHSRAPLGALRALGHGNERATDIEFSPDLLVVQTTHAVAVEPQFTIRGCNEGSALARIECVLHPLIIIRNGSLEVIASCSYDVAVDGRTVMQAEAGLLIRTLNQQPLQEAPA